MVHRPRIYDAMLADHLRNHRQMAMFCGPRQVGKTTVCRRAADTYLDWDNTDDRRTILAGPGSVAVRMGLDRLRERPPVVAFDELHKFARWKGFLKGFFDTYGDRMRATVTGSSRMDVFRRGGDSLMGRYFLYRIHPFSVAEVLHHDLPDPQHIVRPPRAIAEADFDALLEHGGYPEPYLKRDIRFTRRWRSLRQHQLLREDIRDLTRVQELGQLEALATVLIDHCGDQIVYSNLSKELQVSVDTVRRWIRTLCGFHLGFLLRPWYRNVSRSVRKEPKWYLRDWSGVGDIGKRAETFVACHLLKAVEGWTDLGLGAFELGYLRDKSGREVDFVVARDRRPWMLVEVKASDVSPSGALAHFQKQTQAPHAFQVVLDAEYVQADCFAHKGSPLVVPARNFLSQLL